MKKINECIAYLKASANTDQGEKIFKVPFDDEPVLTDIGNGLLVSYLIDEGSRFTYVQNRDLIENGITNEELENIGINNLIKIANENINIENNGTIYKINLDNNFEASLILINNLWDTIKNQFGIENICVAIPARNALAFGDSELFNVKNELNDLIRKTWDSETHLLLKDILYQKSGKWGK